MIKNVQRCSIEGGDIDIVVTNTSPEALGRTYTAFIDKIHTDGAVFSVQGLTETLVTGALQLNDLPPVKIQIIHVPYHNCASETIAAFDLSVCKVAMGLSVDEAGKSVAGMYTFTAAPATVMDVQGELVPVHVPPYFAIGNTK